MSHPSWVRGLKYILSRCPFHSKLSHPSWVRGLKFVLNSGCIFSFWSHPSWVRGLKYIRIMGIESNADVAPLVGAWIEIYH